MALYIQQECLGWSIKLLFLSSKSACLEEDLLALLKIKQERSARAEGRPKKNLKLTKTKNPRGAEGPGREARQETEGRGQKAQRAKEGRGRLAGSKRSGGERANGRRRRGAAAQNKGGEQA